MNTNNNNIIVLPGTDAQIPLINRLRSMGFKVTVFNPYDDSPAFPFADDYRKVNILDKISCLTFAKEIAPIAVLSDMCDIAMPTVAYISDFLGLYSLGHRCASLYTDKWEMREFCKQHNIPSPNYQLCFDINQAKFFLRTQSAKCIIKPIDSNSSRGVFLLNTEQDIDSHFDEALSFSKCQKAVLIEQYINGVEFTIDGLMTPTGHKSLAISEKKHYRHNPNIAYELFFSQHNPNYDYNILRSTNDNYVNLSKLPIGCFTHAEYKYENGEFYLIEIGARGGGNFISSDIVPCLTGVDNYRFLIEAMVGQQFRDIHISPEFSDRCVVLYFFDVEEDGIVASLQGEDLLRRDKRIIRYHFNCKIGDMIKKAENDSARVGFYIAYADTRYELLELMQNINDKVKILTRQQV